MPGWATALMLCAMTATAAQGDVLFARYFPKKACYAHAYDAQHLAAHPRQHVRSLEIDFDTRDPDGKTNAAAAFQLGFGFKLRGKSAWYGDGAYCKAAAGYFDCYLDADGGLFHLVPDGENLRLEVLNRGGVTKNGDQINVEADDGSVGFGAPAGDDLVFVLQPAPQKICDESNR